MQIIVLDDKRAPKWKYKSAQQCVNVRTETWQAYRVFHLQIGYIVSGKKKKKKLSVPDLYFKALVTQENKYS